MLAKEQLTCVSCGRRISPTLRAVAFYCPNCGTTRIIRCYTCRQYGREYVCPSCSFVGP
ncbi:MAG: RNA-binding protein [Thermoproteota archaeon]|nr:MAG: RNA-binding protein [Candidatus Korarchaeota archaeon]RLG55140.1 MAG: RNA-binding protein [Candidatus Korarchaeota archaeon]